MWGKQPPPRPAADVPITPHAAPPEPARAELPSLRETSLSSRITSGISIEGEIRGRENIYIDGEVRGTVTMREAQVTVGPRGRIRADIEAREIDVQGRVEGSLEARDRIRIGASGSVRGNLSAQRLAIDEGAFFQGSVALVRPGETREPPPAPRARAAAAAPASTPERAGEAVPSLDTAESTD
jgi:cytoskeletal protein CcmA (bactofilin family)